jgi:transmembrane sensor
MKKTQSIDPAVEKVASEWVIRSAAPLSPESQAELQAWLAADPRHTETYVRMLRTWAVFGRAQQKGAAGEISTKVAQRGVRRRRRRLQITAAAAVLALGGFLFALRPARLPEPVAAKIDTIADLIRKLPDGSVVELNKGAEIAVRYDGTHRRVVLLKGEAHFRVAKDPAHAFLVQAGKVEVVAVGTAFTVQLAQREVEVVVTEGRVAIDRGGQPLPSAATPPWVPPPTLVDAGNRVVVNTAEAAIVPPLVRSMSELEIEKRLAWRASLLEFEGLELAQAVALMNRANRVQISLADDTIGRLRISGTFRADNPEGFVRIVGSTFELKTDRRGENEIVLRRL